MISGRSFADRCKWVVDPRYPDRPTFQHGSARHGDWVFVNGDYLGTYLRLFPAISTKSFVVIVHNSDRPFGKVELDAMLPRSIHIYAINTTVEHPQLTTIPLGFVDRQLHLIKGFSCKTADRPNEVYMNFAVGTNAPKRAECMDAVRDNRRVVRAENVSPLQYYMDLCKSRFVLCPEGTGIDTHRVYESLLCGATPVVLRNSLSRLYEKLPVCIVDKWTDEYTVPPQKEYQLDVSWFL